METMIQPKVTGYRQLSDSETLAQAQDRLGHQSAAVTARVYRRGQKVTPLR